MRTSRTVFKIDQSKRYSISYQVAFDSFSMRRTRKNNLVETVVSHTASVKRSLRNKHSDDIQEIPANFRLRSPRSSGQSLTEKEIEKSPTTKRNTRSNGGGTIEEFNPADVETCKSRKRRFQSSPTECSPVCSLRVTRASSTKDGNYADNGPRPSKVPHVDEDCIDTAATSPPLVNGICSRTRRKLIENGGCETPTNITDEAGTPIKNNFHSANSNGVSLDATECTSTHKRTSRSISCSSSDSKSTRQLHKASNSSPGSQDAESSSSEQMICNGNGESNHSSHECDEICECKSNVKHVIKNVCEICGKLRSRVQNGTIAYSPTKSPASSNVKSPDSANILTPSHQLRSTGHPRNTLSSNDGSDSPLSAEEASQSLKKVDSDDINSSSLRRSRRISEKGDFPNDIADMTSSIIKKREPDATSSDGDSNSRESPAIEQHPSNDLEEIDKQCETETDDASPLSVEKSNCEIAISDKNEADSVDPQQDEEHPVDQDAETSMEKNNPRNTPSPTDLDEFSCGDFDFSHMSDSGSDETISKKRKRKMNLRSSGVRCDPDFYTLSLDLMIKRSHRKGFGSFEVGAIKQERDEESKQANAEDNELELNGESNPVQPTETVDSVMHDCRPCTANGEIDINSSNLKVSSKANARESITDKDEAPLQPPDKDGNVLLPPQHSSTPNRPLCSHKFIPRVKSRTLRGFAMAMNEKIPAPGFQMVISDPREPPPLFVEEPPSGPDVYYFESDHVALKHNHDYHKLLHTVSMLESQRYQCLGDIERLENSKSSAMEKPIAFVEKLQKQAKLNLPHQQEIPDLPDINWSRYTSVYGTFDHVFSQDFVPTPKKHITRRLKINFETGVPLQSSQNPPAESKNKIENSNQGETSRSQTFKLAWTVEEQRKLEELLMNFPSEEVEFRRYRKIAAALGNRTPMQVQSRVQKYFLKLAKAGLPVPGRMPKMDKSVSCLINKKVKSRPHPHQSLTRISTFFPKFHVPVRMTDEDAGRPRAKEEDDGDGWTIDQEQVSDEEDIPQEMRYSDEYLEILRLKRMRRERLRVFDQHGRQALAQHVGYECDMCNSDPIQGVRYHCIDCPEGDGVDLCQSCIRWQGQFITEFHKTSHRMEPVYKAENFMDDDYLKFVSRSGEYNYLDPNFFPPNT